MAQAWNTIEWPVVWIIVCSKTITYLAIAGAYRLFPFLSWTYYSALHYPSNEGISLLTAYKTWGAQHYIYLSQVGYHAGGPSNDYYPLLPALMHLVSIPLHSPLIAGLLSSNICSLIGLYYLYLFVKRLSGDRHVAMLSLLFLLALPTSFYLSLIYTEALFLMLAVCFFYYLYQGNYPACSVFGFLLPLARPLGVFIVLPWLVYHVAAKRASATTAAPIRARRGGSRKSARDTRRREKAVVRWNTVLSFGPAKPASVAFIAAPLAGYATYLLYMLRATGDAFASFTQEQASLGAWHIQDILRPDLLVSNFFLPFTMSLPDFGFTAPTASPLDRLFFVLFLVGIPLVLIETDIALLSFYLLLGSVPLLGSFMSYSRYLMPAFPLYIAAARFSTVRHLRMLPACWLVASGVAWFILLGRHALGYWVA